MDRARITLRLSELVSPSIATRNALREALEAYFFSDLEVVVDFVDVEFMTRSSAHAYLRLKQQATASVKEVNVSEDVQKMFRVATKSTCLPAYEPF